MSAGEISSLLMAVAALVGSYAALTSARNSAAKITDLEKENEKLRTEMTQKEEHNQHQDAVIMDQQRKIEKWHKWGQTVGRMMNQMQLQIGEPDRSNMDTFPMFKLSDEKGDDEG